MEDSEFNLTTDPWVKVFETKSNREIEVSLIDLFSNSQDYRMLAGEMHSQDVAVMRLLLAILTTVYSRADANGEAYPWMQSVRDLKSWSKADRDKQLLDTWHIIYKSGHFSQTVIDYLQVHQSEFDFFGKKPFYQATAEEYDSLVPDNRRIDTGKGRVGAMMINRTIAQSAHTVDIFAGKTPETKNKLSVSELIRWVIMYQSYTGVTDKTKIVPVGDEKIRSNAGWLYKMIPVYIQGNSVFETLMMNLILEAPEDGEDQRPVWEYDSVSDYVEVQRKQGMPGNLAALYTAWTRVLHIDWVGPDEPIIFSAAIPMYDNLNATIEPMTGWRFQKRFGGYKPILTTLAARNQRLWWNFDSYFPSVSDTITHRPGIINWIAAIHDSGLTIPDTARLVSTVLVSEDNPSSQIPALEFTDMLPVGLVMLLNPRWRDMISEAVSLNLKVNADYYHFVSDLGTIRGKNPRIVANSMMTGYYQNLDKVFKSWLEGITSDSDPDAELKTWRTELVDFIHQQIEEITPSPRDMRGITTKHGIMNFSTINNLLNYQVVKHITD